MNILTNSMEKLTKMLNATDSKLKGMADLPYGTRKLSSREQRQRFENLTPEEVARMIEEYGVNEVNAYLNKYMED